MRNWLISHSQHLRVLILFTVLAFNTNYLIFNTLLPPAVFAQQAPCDLKMPDGSYQCPAAGITQVQELMTRLINISVTVAFMAMTVWLAWSAIKFFITSGGDPKALSQAWASVTWIFMGIVFMVLAYLALRLIAAFSGVDVTNYCLGFPPYCI